MPGQSLVSSANTGFCLDLLARLEKTAFFSPFSIESAMAMTMCGTEGDTRKEMQATLHLEFPETDIDSGFNILLNMFHGNGECTLNIANAIFAAKDIAIKDAFLEKVDKFYKSESRSCDFKTNAEGERNAINAWVEHHTANKIKNLITQGLITHDTLMVLVNAIYFKGDWKIPFDKKFTSDHDFYGSEVQTVPTMQRSGEIPLYEDANMSAVRLDYVGDIAMIVFLPTERDGLPGIEKNWLSEDKLKSVISSLSQQWGDGIAKADTVVNLRLPRFRIESQYNLTPTLQQMGMKLAFTKADFTRLTDVPCAISAVVHKAFVEVDEKGTEAAAATACMVSFCSFPSYHPRRVNFFVDHPFMFAIVHKPTSSILFFGRIEKII